MFLRQIPFAIRKTDLFPMFHSRLRAEDPNIWAGVELGAVPIAVACSLDSGTPYVIVRKKPKEHGTQSLIEGPYKAGQTVLLVEDVVTTGESSARAIQALRDVGLVLRGVIAVVDRNHGGAERFRALGVPYQALVTAQEILDWTRTDKCRNCRGTTKIDFQSTSLTGDGRVETPITISCPSCGHVVNTVAEGSVFCGKEDSQ